MTRKPSRYKTKKMPVPDPTSDNGWTEIYKAVPHPYYRREVLLAKAGKRDVQSKITWWCEYYA